MGGEGLLDLYNTKTKLVRNSIVYCKTVQEAKKISAENRWAFRAVRGKDPRVEARYGSLKTGGGRIVLRPGDVAELIPFKGSFSVRFLVEVIAELDSFMWEQGFEE